MVYIKYCINITVSLSLAIILLPRPAAADINTLPVDEKTRSISLGQYLMIREDKKGDLTIEQASSKTLESSYILCKTATPTFGYTDSVYWVRISLISHCRERCEWFLELKYPLMDRFSIFIPGGDGTFEENKLGNFEPFSTRTYKRRNPVITLEINPGETKTYYMRFQNKDRMEFPMILWSPESFNDNIYFEQFVYGIYYGILLVMFIYSLFLFFSVKDISYFHYIIYILAMALFQLGQNGYLYQFLSQFKDPPPVHFIPLTQAFFIFGIINFSQSFLITKKNAKVMHRTLNILKAASIVYVMLPILVDYTVCIIIGVILTFLMIPLVIATGTMVMLKGYRPAYYYMAAWSVMFVVGFIFLFRVLAVIPNNIITNNILHIGTSIEIILWSIGLGDRYNLIKKEQDRIAHEMQIARQIHGSIIPYRLPEFKGITSYAEYIPMDEVGGDLFDYHIINDNCIGIMIADVAGHSIPAAIVASMVKVAFSLQVNHAHDPVKVMYGMADILKNKLRNTFITAGYIYLDLEKKVLQYAKCGHLPLYIFKNDDMKLLHLEPKGRLICELPLETVEMATMQLSSNDRIIMLTDGIIEAINKRGQLFGFHRLETFIIKNFQQNVKEFSHRLIKTINVWRSSKESFDDDITLIVLDID